MDIGNSIHNKAMDLIKEQRENGKTWEQITELDIFGIGELPFEQAFGMARSVLGLGKDYTPHEWKILVEHIKEKESERGKSITKIERGTMNNAEISTSKHSAWRLYRSGLLNKGWTRDSVDSIEDASFGILKLLSQDTINSGPVKGLVVGNVQSGKTANMAGLISMAADYGFNYFIVLSGMIENLRQQTEERLYDDVANKGNLDWHIIKNPHPNRVYNPSDKMENLRLEPNSTSRYLSVILKNSTRLNNLVKWLYSNPAKAKQFKILVIDDEADQGSINTGKMNDESEEIERTKINRQLINLVHGYNNLKLQAVNYISYTATPYANVLNEAIEYSLYPSDFIITLNPSPDYIGPKQIFGLSDPETNPPVDITEYIPENDERQLQDIHDGYVHGIPKSLKQAIQWFLISAMAMKVNGHKKPITMLVHTSQKINDHENIEKVIDHYLRQVKSGNREEFLNECENTFNVQRGRFTKRDFVEGMGNYSVSIEEINDYPEWSEIEKYLKALLSEDEENYLSRIKIDDDGKLHYHRGIHLCIDNSRTAMADDEHIRLVYPDKSDKIPHATLFIVIGGNTLSRGLTLEGLTTSYFMRNTMMSDTLMQMGRWFGYRFGYEIFPRIWLNSDTRKRFDEITQIDEELRDEIKDFNRNGYTPRDVGIKVKNSLNNAFLKITSNNKMQGAIETDLNFAGLQRQTIVFEDEYETLKHNLQVADNFLNNLNEPVHNGTRLVWHGVTFDKIRDEFFKKYKAPDKDIMFSNLDSFIEWCEKNDDNKALDDWNVILSSKGTITEGISGNDWDIQGYGVSDVTRTVLGEISTEPRAVTIGALRSPKDLLSDIIEIDKEDISGTKRISEVKEIREDYGYDKNPQLVIYRIDKNSEPKGTSENRQALNFSEDIIGISIMIPGIRSSSNIATKITVKIDENNGEDLEIEEN